MQNTGATDKDSLRRDTLQKLRALPAAQVQADSARLRQLLITALGDARCVCIYAPLPHEVNLLPLLIESPRRSYCFPRCLSGRRLSFHRVQKPESELAPAAMGILAPLPHLPAISPHEADAVIVPGVAFTREGKRLGYGGGYYDRFLPLLRQDTAIISLALPQQLVPHLPTDEHDIRIPHLITLPA